LTRISRVTLSSCSISPSLDTLRLQRGRGKWLASHPEIQMYEHELYSLAQGKPAELVSQLYALPAGRKYKRGYKAPNDIRSIEALDGIAEHWPNCKLIIGLRHPVT
jgi:hypothetical protein